MTLNKKVKLIRMTKENIVAIYKLVLQTFFLFVKY